MEGEYLAAINRTGRTTLGASQSTLLGIVVAVSRLAPARALLDHRQTRFTPRLLARPQGHGGPEEIMSRQGADPTARPQGATHLRPGELGGMAELGEVCNLPGKDSQGGRRGKPSGPPKRASTVWTDGSRLDNGKVGAAVAGWKEACTPQPWIGPRGATHRPNGADLGGGRKGNPTLAAGGRMTLRRIVKRG